MWIDVVCLLALAGICATCVIALRGAVDLAPWDEADYLRRGLEFPGRSLPPAEWGPLYALWYFAVSRLTTSPVAAFDLSYAALIVLPCFAVYACARRFGGSPVVALTGAGLFLLALAPHVLPRPSLLALLIVLIACAVTAGVRRFGTFALCLSLAFLLASFARPESFVSFGLCSAVMAVSIVRRVRREPGAWRGVAGRFAFWGASAALLLAVFGNPMADKTNRGLYAFCQHFALGEVARAKLPFDPWGQCDAVLERSFGHVHSVGEAARRNPGAFATHVLANAERWPRESFSVFLREQGSARIDRGPWTFRRMIHLGMLGLLALWIGLGLIRGLGPGGAQRMLASEPVRRMALVTLAAMVPTVASVLLIWPREHYLVLQGVLIPLFLVAVFGAAWRSTDRWRTASGAAAVALAIGLAFSGIGLLADAHPERTLPNRAVVAALQRSLAARPGEPVFVLEAQGGYDAYLGPDFRRVSPVQRQPGESFPDFISRTHVEAVVLEDALLRDRTLREDASFQGFLAAPQAFGFELRAVPGTDRQIALRAPANLNARSAPGVERWRTPGRAGRDAPLGRVHLAQP